MTQELNLTEEELNQAIEGEIVNQILEAENQKDVNMAEATAQANGFEENETSNQAEELEEEQNDQDFESLRNSVSETRMKEMHSRLEAAFATRASYEREKNQNNDKIQTTISKLTKKMEAAGMVKTAVVSDFDVSQINKMEQKNARRNVYAIEKSVATLYFAATGHGLSPVHAAVIASLVRCADVKLDFTYKVAKAAVCDKEPIDTCYLPYLRRHTVSTNTVVTQTSSSMKSLEDLGIVKEIDGKYVLQNTLLAKQVVAQARKMLMPVKI